MSFSKLKLEESDFGSFKSVDQFYDIAEFEMTSTARNATNFEKKKNPDVWRE